MNRSSYNYLRMYIYEVSKIPCPCFHESIEFFRYVVISAIKSRLSERSIIGMSIKEKFDYETRNLMERSIIRIF